MNLFCYFKCEGTGPLLQLSMAGFSMNISLFSTMRRLTALGLLVCFFAGPVRADENEVIIVSPHWDGIKEETARAFSAWHEKKYGRSAIIHWREQGGGGSQIIRFLRSEYNLSPNVDIDVLYGGGVDPFLDLKKNGLLTRYDPPEEILAQIPAQLNGM